MFVWNLNFQQTVSGPTDEKWGWGVLRNDLSPSARLHGAEELPEVT